MRLRQLAIFALFLFLTACGSSSSTTSPALKAQTVGGEETNVINSVDQMTAGDIYYVDFDSEGVASIDFSAIGEESTYILIVQSTTSSSSNIGITSANVSDSFDKLLRTSESKLSEENMEPVQNVTKDLSVTKSVGDTESFRVLSSLSSTSSYTTVTATSRCEEDHILLYVDSALDSDNLDEDDIATLCAYYEQAISMEFNLLGETSDINGDGHVAVLITPAINQLGASGGGIITGYFYAADLYPRSGSNPTSNEMEIVYILAPDPQGTYGVTISKNFSMSNLMPAVVPHEVQHAISYNMHVFENGGSSESSWLNESMSHFAEDLTGFGVENPSRVDMFLQAPEDVSLAASGSPDLYERGAGYLFIRYLYERSASPDEFLAALENTSNTGMVNVETAFGDSDLNFDEWREFMRRWAIALALTNTGISSTSQYQFDDRTFNTTTGYYQGACLICDANDNRGTVLTGPYMEEISASTLSTSLTGTATAFYTISTPPSSLTIDGNASSELQGVLIRTQ